MKKKVLFLNESIGARPLLQRLRNVAPQVGLGVHAYHFFDDSPILPDEE